MSMGPDFQFIADAQNCQLEETLHSRACGTWKTPDAWRFLLCHGIVNNQFHPDARQPSVTRCSSAWKF
jgi:hypothetical protein